MRNVMRAALTGALLAGWATSSSAAQVERSLASSAFHTSVAVVANVVPVVSTIYAPRCLSGYVFCKAIFAGISVIAAADQLAFSGGADMGQTRAILYRGFRGDWVITPRHVAGEATPEPLPEPPPPAGGSNGGWEPPPL